MRKEGLEPGWLMCPATGQALSASCNHLERHLKHVLEGVMASWLTLAVVQGRVQVIGPYKKCAVWGGGFWKQRKTKSQNH